MTGHLARNGVKVMTKDELTSQWEQNDRLEIEQALSALLSTPVGRRYLRRLLAFGKIGQQPFTTNALTMSFQCGELNVGQQILADILSVNPDGYVMMQKEANDEWNTRDQAIRDADESR